MNKGKKVREKDTIIYSLLRSDDKGISQAEGILSRLLRIIMCDRDIGPMKYSRLMFEWLMGQPDNIDKLSERGNMNKDIYGTNMTWNSLLKCLVFLKAKKFKLTLTIQWDDEGKDVSEHYINVEDPKGFIVRKTRIRADRVRKGKGKSAKASSSKEDDKD